MDSRQKSGSYKSPKLLYRGSSIIRGRNKVSFLKESLAKSSIILVKKSLNFQFSNVLRIIEMVPVLKKLKVWTLYVHIVAQVNHRGLGVRVEKTV